MTASGLLSETEGARTWRWQKTRLHVSSLLEILENLYLHFPKSLNSVIVSLAHRTRNTFKFIIFGSKSWDVRPYKVMNSEQEKYTHFSVTRIFFTYLLVLLFKMSVFIHLPVAQNKLLVNYVLRPTRCNLFTYFTMKNSSAYYEQIYFSSSGSTFYCICRYWYVSCIYSKKCFLRMKNMSVHNMQRNFS